MKYFLTGITGFIGSNLARELLTNGHIVHALVRNPADLRQFDHANLRIFKGDLGNIPALRFAMEGCELGFHLAAFARPWSKDPDYAYKINVEGAGNVFSIARYTGIRKVVFTSSAATMSPSGGLEPVDEATPRTMRYFNAYETTKAEAEALAVEYSGKGLPVVIVNPSRVYGPGPLTVANSLTRMMAGYWKGTWRIIPGDGRKIGSYVFIDDVVRGHLLAAQNGRGGERYILGGENLSFDELFLTLGSISGNYRRMVHFPLWLMLGLARLIERQAGLTGIPPKITSNWVKKYLNNWSLSSDKAVRELGYKITPFEEGARKTLVWLKETESRAILKTDWRFAH